MQQLTHEIQDLTYLSWSKLRNSSGTAGSFLKASSVLGGTKTYYKLSNYDTCKGVIGHECVNELIVDRLLTVLGVEHLSYRLIHADVLIGPRTETVWLNSSEDFKGPNEDKLALDAYYDANKATGEGSLEFCIRQGWSSYIWQMIAVDFLIQNRDRHGANIEVLRNKKKRAIRLAPLFDHGLSLLYSCHTDKEAAAFEVMEDRPVNNFIGSHSTKENLNLIPADAMPEFQPLGINQKSFILEGLDGILSPVMQDKIWEMIWERWCYYEDFRNSRRF